MSCLFRSIGNLIGEPHPAVRKAICDYMHANIDTDYDGMPLGEWIQWQRQSSTPAEYIRAMRKPSEWGGATELAMAAKLYGVDIRVRDGGTNRQLAEFLWREQCSARVALILQWTGVHYEPVERRLLG
jgi:hypothetical protein